MEDVTVESLQAQMNEQKEAFEQKIADLTKLIGGAKVVETAEVKLPTIPTETVKVQGKEYKFTVASFQMPGTRDQLISEEVATDLKMLLAIVAIDGQGILKEVK